MAMTDREQFERISEQRTWQLLIACVSILIFTLIVVLSYKEHLYDQAQIKAGNCRTLDAQGREIWLPCNPKFEGGR